MTADVLSEAKARDAQADDYSKKPFSIE